MYASDIYWRSWLALLSAISRDLRLRVWRLGDWKKIEIWSSLRIWP